MSIVEKKRKLLAELRSSGVFVLEKGAIEKYYPDTVTGRDKPSKAQSFCDKVSSYQELCDLCESVACSGGTKPELRLIMESIFEA